MFGIEGDESENSVKKKEALIKYSWLYSIYSFPNIIIPFFGGYFVDRIGVRKGIIIFSCFLLIG